MINNRKQLEKAFGAPTTIDGTIVFNANPETTSIKIRSSGRENVVVVRPQDKNASINIDLRSEKSCIYIGPGLMRVTVVAGYGCCLIIGDGTTFTRPAQFTLAENKDIFVGEKCMFASDVVVSNTDGHPIFDATGQRINLGRDVVIGNGVWLGRGVDVLKGSYIHSGAIVGAKADVTGRLAANSISIGTPARTIRENVTFDRGTTVKAPLVDNMKTVPELHPPLQLENVEIYRLMSGCFR